MGFCNGKCLEFMMNTFSALFLRILISALRTLSEVLSEVEGIHSLGFFCSWFTGHTGLFEHLNNIMNPSLGLSINLE